MIGGGALGRSTPGVGANVLLVPDTSAAEVAAATMVINFIVIELNKVG